MRGKWQNPGGGAPLVIAGVSCSTCAHWDTDAAWTANHGYCTHPNGWHRAKLMPSHEMCSKFEAIPSLEADSADNGGNVTKLAWQTKGCVECGSWADVGTPVGTFCEPCWTTVLERNTGEIRHSSTTSRLARVLSSKKLKERRGCGRSKVRLA